MKKAVKYTAAVCACVMLTGCASDRSSGHRKQKIEIYYKAAGIINIADEDCVAEDGRKERWRNTKSA